MCNTDDIYRIRKIYPSLQHGKDVLSYFKGNWNISEVIMEPKVHQWQAFGTLKIMFIFFIILILVFIRSQIPQIFSHLDPMKLYLAEKKVCGPSATLQEAAGVSAGSNGRHVLRDSEGRKTDSSSHCLKQPTPQLQFLTPLVSTS